MSKCEQLELDLKEWMNRLGCCLKIEESIDTWFKSAWMLRRELALKDAEAASRLLKYLTFVIGIEKSAFMTKDTVTDTQASLRQLEAHLGALKRDELYLFHDGYLNFLH